ncbi:MAG: ribbon-helix-helix protein, CopG family [Aquificae bacterium]|nr:ribbon-helix-helix protein, CopG family [Aquificota bacterium]
MGKTVRFGDETLKQVEGFPSYAVSDKGFVYRGFDKGLLPESYKQFRLKTFTTKKGYQVVQLSNGGKRKVFYVHRLVAQHFLPNEKGYRYVKHLDGDRTNNSVDNLRWTASPRRKRGLKSEGKKVILSLSVPSHLKARLEERAEQEGKTVSQLITDLLEEVL